MRKGDKIYFAVTGAIALAGLLFFVFNGRERLRYRLPAFPEVKDTAVTRLVIRPGGSEPLTVARDGESWIIVETGHKADPDRVKMMLNHLLVSGAVDLVSESGHDATYGFDGDKPVQVELHAGDRVVRSFRIGALTPSAGYTYIRLDDSRKTYTLRGDLSALFRTDAARLRDKSVLRYDDTAITEVVLTGPGGQRLKITRSEDEEQIIWRDESGRTFETYRLDNIIIRYSKLRCVDFVPPLSEEILSGESFSVEMNGSENRLIVYGREGDPLYASSSQSQEPFLLAADDAKWIFKLLED